MNYPLLFLLTPLKGNAQFSEDLRKNFFNTLSAFGFQIAIGSDGTFKFTRKVTENRSIVVKVEGELVFLFIAKTSPTRTLLVEVEQLPLEVKEDIFFAKIKTLETILSKKLCK